MMLMLIGLIFIDSNAVNRKRDWMKKKKMSRVNLLLLLLYRNTLFISIDGKRNSITQRQREHLIFRLANPIQFESDLHE